FVAQDGEQPCLHIGAGLERALLRPGLHDRILNKVVGAVVTSGQRHAESAQTAQAGQQRTLEVLVIAINICRHYFGSPPEADFSAARAASSSMSSRSRNLSGMASS